MNKQQQQEMLQRALVQYPGLSGELKTLTNEQLMQFAIPPNIDYSLKKSGEYSIEMDVIPKGEPMTVVSMRNSLLMGYKPQKICLDTFRIIHKLKKGKDLLMSDSPQEMFLQYTCVENAHGKVLVGGLGLGMYANMIAEKEEVTEVVVVEISEDVIKLSKPNNPKIRVVHMDISEFIKSTKEKFDYAYVDIYYGTGAYEYLNIVLPLKKLIVKKFPKLKVEFWAEKEMKSQIKDR